MASKSIPAPGEPSMQERYPRTISVNLYDSWQVLRRYGDAARISKNKKISRPIVDRAINYGHVNNPHVTNKINAYFGIRIDKESKLGSKFISSAKKG